jgi:small subunit ribosomal protein S16
LLRIRLSRVGKKKKPAYRLIVADSRSPREGAFLKIIGHYNPLTEPVTLVVKEDEAVYWLQKGAQPSDTAAKLLTRLGVMERAGKAPVKYEGKQVEPAAKKAKAEPKAAAPEAPAAEAPSADTESPEPAPEAAAEAAEPEAPAEAAAEAQPETEAETTESKE